MGRSQGAMGSCLYVFCLFVYLVVSVTIMNCLFPSYPQSTPSLPPYSYPHHPTVFLSTKALDPQCLPYLFPLRGLNFKRPPPDPVLPLLWKEVALPGRGAVLKIRGRETKIKIIIETKRGFKAYLILPERALLFVWF